MITKTQSVVYIIFNGGNAIMLIYYIYDIILISTNLEHLTRWSYYANSVFTTICLICDIISYFGQNEGSSEETKLYYELMEENKDKKNNWVENLNNWNRNKFAVVCNTYSYLVSIGFWLIYIFGNEYMLVSQNIRSWFNTLYHHLIITVILIIDLFFSNRKKHNFSWDYFWIITLIYLFYYAIVTSEKYIFGRPAYKFVRESSFLFLIGLFLVAYIFLCLSYLIHIFLLRLKQKYFGLESNENENKNLNEQFFEEGKL